MEEGSKLSSVGNDAFKDNSFFVSIDLSNSSQDMTFGSNAFMGMPNLTEFSTGSGKLTLNTKALTDLVNCKVFNLSAKTVVFNTPFDITLTNPSNALAVTTVGSYTPVVTAVLTTGYDGNGGRYYWNGITSVTAMTFNASSLSSVTGVLSPQYSYQYDHPLMNLGKNVGCVINIKKFVETIPDDLFTAGVNIETKTNLTNTTVNLHARIQRAVTFYGASYTHMGSSWAYRAYLNHSFNPNISSTAYSYAITKPAEHTTQKFIDYNINISEVISSDAASKLSKIGVNSFGIGNYRYSSNLSTTANGTIISQSGAGQFNMPNLNSSGDPAKTQNITATSAASLNSTFNIPVSMAKSYTKNVSPFLANFASEKSHVKRVMLSNVKDGCVIDRNAFGLCDLEDVYLGNNIATINDHAFYGVNDASTAYVYGKSSNTFKPDSNNGLTSGGLSNIGSIVYLPDAKDLGRYINHYQIGDAVTAYLFEQIDGTYVINIVGTGATYDTYTESTLPGWHATYGTKVSKVIVDDTVTSVGPYLFYGHTALTTVQFGTGLTSIGAHAFGNCTGLDSFTVPATLTSVGERILEGAAVKKVYYNANTEDAYHSMSGCDAEEIILGANVTKIGDGTLGDISGKFFVAQGNTHLFVNEYGHLLSRNPDTGVVSLLTYAKDITDEAFVLDGVNTVNAGAFYGANAALKSVSFGNSVTAIGNNAFGTGKTPLTIYVYDFQTMDNLESQVSPLGTKWSGTDDHSNVQFVSQKWDIGDQASLRSIKQFSFVEAGVASEVKKSPSHSEKQSRQRKIMF